MFVIGVYKYEILLHGFGLPSRTLEFSNGDFRLWSDVGYRSSVQDGILAGELKILLLTIYKK